MKWLEEHKQELGKGKVTNWITSLVNEGVLRESTENGSQAKYISLNLEADEDDGA